MISLKKFLNLEFYISKTDLFLSSYDKSHPGHSHAQQKEIDKYQRIYKLRDKINPPENTQTFWDKF